MSLLKIQSLSVEYHSSRKVSDRALTDLGLCIEEGEIVSMVGESGSGKSTAALCIGRLIPESIANITGEIIFDGQNALQCSEKDMMRIRRQSLGYVFQNPHLSLNPVMRIKEQLYESVTHEEVDWPKVLEQMQFKDPERVMNNYPHELSGGMKQRIVIAMAIAKRPKLLIADEPTTALDPSIQWEILELLKKINEEYKISILFITHDLRVAHSLSSKMVILKNGVEIESINCSTELNPSSQYGKKLITASFLPKTPKTKIDIES